MNFLALFFKICSRNFLFNTEKTKITQVFGFLVKTNFWRTVLDSSFNELPDYPYLAQNLNCYYLQVLHTHFYIFSVSQQKDGKIIARISCSILIDAKCCAFFNVKFIFFEIGPENFIFNRLYWLELWTHIFHDIYHRTTEEHS